jgi:imidazoleglycerol-phosphate dehydratase
MRTAKITRNTKETQIQLELNLDGNGVSTDDNGESTISTGIGFFDHMLTLFAAHSMIDLTVEAKGDLYIDGHHTVEDAGIVFGKALASALGDKKGIRRYGSAAIPMDETLVTAAVDFSGRSYLVYNIGFPTPKIGQFDTELVHEFWQAVANASNCTLHLALHYGENAHHIAEAIFKAAARSIRAAVEIDPRQKEIPSTKGTL